MADARICPGFLSGNLYFELAVMPEVTGGYKRVRTEESVCVRRTPFDEKGFLSGNFELAVMANAGYTGGEGWLYKNECVPLSEGCSEGYTGG